MLNLNLRPIFQARGIERPYTYLVKAGISRATAHNILNSKTRVFRLDHIELLCRVLICEPNDLLAYVPDPDSLLQDTHPLNNLIQDETSKPGIKESFANIPYKELKEITKQLVINK
jgi:DNA-binding Xre family transcriptional regulator